MFATARLSVREYHPPSDNMSLFKIFTDKLVGKYTIWDVPKNLMDVKKVMEKYNYKVIYQDNKLIGFCRLNELKTGLYNIGYYLDFTEWGKGYATEVALGLIRYAFEELGARKVSATCDPRNVHSERVLKRCGMCYEGHVREDVLLPCGRWRDSLYYSMLKHEFEQLSW